MKFVMEKKMREGAERKPKLYEIFQGEVVNLQTYGAFITIPGSRKQGLLHKSQMSTARIEDPSEMLAKGEKVYCKIIAVTVKNVALLRLQLYAFISLDLCLLPYYVQCATEHFCRRACFVSGYPSKEDAFSPNELMDDGEKVSLSMKVVNQTTGEDLDKNNVQSSQDEKKRRQWNIKANNKIELGAELNSICRRCGGYGHLTIDCFVGNRDNQYDLVPEMEKFIEMIDADERSTSSKKKKKKEKKKSKKKKHASSSLSDSASDEDILSIVSKKRKGDTDEKTHHAIPFHSQILKHSRHLSSYEKEVHNVSGKKGKKYKLKKITNKGETERSQPHIYPTSSDDSVSNGSFVHNKSGHDRGDDRKKSKVPNSNEEGLAKSNHNVSSSESRVSNSKSLDTKGDIYKVEKMRNKSLVTGCRQRSRSTSPQDGPWKSKKYSSMEETIRFSRVGKKRKMKSCDREEKVQRRNEKSNPHYQSKKCPGKHVERQEEYRGRQYDDR